MLRVLQIDRTWLQTDRTEVTQATNVTTATMVTNVTGKSMNTNNLGLILKDRRKSKKLTLKDIQAISGVHASHIGRIERGERFPSARVLKRLAEPLGFSEIQLFKLAGFLSHKGSMPDPMLTNIIEFWESCLFHHKFLMSPDTQVLVGLTVKHLKEFQLLRGG